VKRIDSHLKALQKFIDSLIVEMIAEPLKSVPLSETVTDAQRIMKERHFDVIGVKNNDGKVVGCLREDAANSDKVENAYEKFGMEEIISSYAPLENCIQRICDRRWLFVLGTTGVEGIVTMADLRKPPMCLMIFGIISLLESALLLQIREQYSDESWKRMLSEERLKKAEELFDKRRKKNQEIGLADCLQFCDKATVLINKTPEFRAKCGFQSKREAKGFIRNIQLLRDNLAHAQDPADGLSWSEICKIVQKAKKITEIILKPA